MTNPGLKDERTVWSREVQARVTDSGAGPRLDFKFDLPERVRAPNGDDIVWRIDAIAANRAADVHYRFPVSIVEPEEEEEEAVAPIMAFQEEMQPATLGPGLEHVERMLAGAGVRITHEQAARLKEIPPEAREKLALLAKNAPKIKKIVFWLVAGFIALQVAPIILSLVFSGG